MNREAWLTEMARLIEPLFGGMRNAIKPYRVTCGFPSKCATSPKARRIGECHGAKASGDGVHELFISPTLEEVVDVGGTVAHELIHVAAGLEAAHGRKFVAMGNRIGLTQGKATSLSPGKDMADTIRKFGEKLGPYPHKALSVSSKPKGAPTTEKLVCTECECSITISFKWLTEAGFPTCGCGGEMTFFNKDETRKS